jgi:ribosomal protein S12 methylthiotransferase accessory factor YcaO
MNPAVRRLRIGVDENGLRHVPDEPMRTSTEAVCASVFSERPVSVEVLDCPIDTSVTCIWCVAFHLDKLWTVLAGTWIRVD